MLLEKFHIDQPVLYLKVVITQLHSYMRRGKTTEVQVHGLDQHPGLGHTHKMISKVVVENAQNSLTATDSVTKMKVMIVVICLTI